MNSRKVLETATFTTMTKWKLFRKIEFWTFLITFWHVNISPYVCRRYWAPPNIHIFSCNHSDSLQTLGEHMWNPVPLMWYIWIGLSTTKVPLYMHETNYPSHNCPEMKNQFSWVKIHQSKNEIQYSRKANAREILLRKTQRPGMSKPVHFHCAMCLCILMRVDQGVYLPKDISSQTLHSPSWVSVLTNASYILRDSRSLWSIQKFLKQKQRA